MRVCLGWGLALGVWDRVVWTVLLEVGREAVSVGSRVEGRMREGECG